MGSSSALLTPIAMRALEKKWDHLVGSPCPTQDHTHMLQWQECGLQDGAPVPAWCLLAAQHWASC